jgi:hypothetical protein
MAIDDVRRITYLGSPEYCIVSVVDRLNPTEPKNGTRNFSSTSVSDCSSVNIGIIMFESSELRERIINVSQTKSKYTNNCLNYHIFGYKTYIN